MITLEIMTLEQMREFFKAFSYDPAVTTPEQMETPYIYNERQVDAHFEKHKSQGKLHFAVMLDNRVIGDVYLKHIDYFAGTCEMGIHMINDDYKGKGYGTQAERLMLEHAFQTLNMNTVYADTLVTNQRSQHVLEKAGFRSIRRDDCNYYYECRRIDWIAGQRCSNTTDQG